MITEDFKLNIWIPGNVPSSKNGKIWTGKFLVHSKACRRYIKETRKYYSDPELKKLFIKATKTLPIDVYFQFYRNSKRKFDFINAAQIVQDLMVKHGWIEDDNADIINPHFLPYIYDKNEPGVSIKIAK